MNKELQDKAWAVLPKDFKEEVRKIYNSFQPQKVREILIMLFGERNLTYDTEVGEMLIISRKAIEEFYNKYLGDALQTVNRLTLRKDINILFGGKCRADEDDIVASKSKFKPQTESDNGETYFLAPRLQVAAAAMQGMLSNPNIIMSRGCLEDNEEYITKHAVMYADALLVEINGKGRA